MWQLLHTQLHLIFSSVAAIACIILSSKLSQLCLLFVRLPLQAPSSKLKVKGWKPKTSTNKLYKYARHMLMGSMTWVCTIVRISRYSDQPAHPHQWHTPHVALMQPFHEASQLLLFCMLVCCPKPLTLDVRCSVIDSITVNSLAKFSCMPAV